MPVLIHKQLDGTQKRVEFTGKPLVIGRLAESDIQVRDAFLSRVHAGISFVNNAFILKDLGSTNGTYRNGARVYECNLSSGDRIQVGNATLIFEIDSATGDGLLRQVPPGMTAPRQIVVSPSASATGLDGVRPSDIKMTMPVQIQPPPAKR